jgi:hypothetical protein
MNKALRLAISADEWSLLRSALREFLTKVRGACVDLDISQFPDNDALALFTFVYFESDDDEHEERNVKANGRLVAQWTKEGDVCVYMTIDESGKEDMGRWFNSEPISGTTFFLPTATKPAELITWRIPWL